MIRREAMVNLFTISLILNHLRPGKTKGHLPRQVTLYIMN